LKRLEVNRELKGAIELTPSEGNATINFNQVSWNFWPGTSQEAKEQILREVFDGVYMAVGYSCVTTMKTDTVDAYILLQGIAPNGDQIGKVSQSATGKTSRHSFDPFGAELSKEYTVDRKASPSVPAGATANDQINFSLNCVRKK
jgi:hypothetical protein